MTDTLEAAAEFVWLHARLIDRHRFAHLFLGADPAPVVATLRGYRNGDGGFGHALEPDLRGPASQPGAVQHALDFLAEAGATGDPMFAGAAAFLAAIARPDGGLPFVLETALDHPRAPWWRSPGSSSLTLTAANAAILLEAGSAHPWLDRASAYCWRRIDALDFGGAYDARYAVAFLDAVPDAARAEAALGRIAPRIVAAGHVQVEPDPGADVFTPLDFAPWPVSRSRRMFAPGAIERHLDVLQAAQQDDGGWTFGWPAWAPAAAHEWRGYVTVRALKVLRANGRLG